MRMIPLATMVTVSGEEADGKVEERTFGGGGWNGCKRGGGTWRMISLVAIVAAPEEETRPMAKSGRGRLERVAVGSWGEGVWRGWMGRV